MKKFGEPCVECIGFTICAPDIACNSQTCNFFRKALEGVQTQPTNSRYVAALEDSYGVLNRMGGALEGCRAELAIVIERLNAAKAPHCT